LGGPPRFRGKGVQRVVRVPLRSAVPAAIRPTAIRAASQSGKPVNGRLAEPTRATAPRTPCEPPERFDAGAARRVSVTPRTPPAALRASTRLRCAGREICTAGAADRAAAAVVAEPQTLRSGFGVPGATGSLSRMSSRPSLAGCLLWPLRHALMLISITTYGFVDDPVR